MSRAFDFAQLFARQRVRYNYRTEADYFAAICARVKGMDASPLERRQVIGVEASSAELFGEALDRGLAVVLQPEPPPIPSYEPVRMYLMHLDQIWRVSGSAAMWSAFREGRASWSSAFEVLHSILLGYSDAQRAVWMARRPRDGWGRRVYMLLSRTQCARVRESGNRSFGSSQIRGTTVCYEPNGKELKARAAMLVPRGRTIARVQLDVDLLRALLEEGRPQGSLTKVVTARLAARFNAGLSSKIELYGAKGWES